MYSRNVRAIFYFLIGLFFYSCAQQSSPTGGPKDTTPPKIVLQTPKNGTTNFNGKVVELAFDEYISVDNLNQQLLITPGIDGVYEFKVNPKGVLITFDKPFRPNTTYTLNFRNAFKDVTEKQAARNVKIVFSSGAHLDSLSIEGTVRDMLTNQPQYDATVGLYQLSDTLKFSKNKPYYFTKTDSSGRYRLENLAPGKYRLAALVDLNNNILYNTDKDKIAFSPNTITLPGYTEKDELKLVFSNQAPMRAPKSLSTAHQYTLIYPRGIDSVHVDFRSKEDSLMYAVMQQNELRFYNILNTTDTLRTRITVVDSLNRPFTHDQKIKFKEPSKRDTREALEVKVTPKDKEAIEKKFKFQISFSKPITKFDPSAIQLEEDTIRNVLLTSDDYSWNAYRTEFTLQKELNIRRDVRITMPKNTFISIEKDTIQAVRIIYPLKDPEKYGIISGEVRGAKSDIIVELLTSDFNPVRSIRNQVNYNFTNIAPGTYRLRLVLDLNKNGRWDSGNPDEFVPPEPIIVFPTIIKLKANFELLGNDFTL
ncbi:MAG: Ig-like domain-containing protein [Siphonobacter sp.]